MSACVPLLYRDTPPKIRSPGLHLELLRDPPWKTRILFYLFPTLVLTHVPPQTFLDFNAIHISIVRVRPYLSDGRVVLVSFYP